MFAQCVYVPRPSCGALRDWAAVFGKEMKLSTAQAAVVSIEYRTPDGISIFNLLLGYPQGAPDTICIDAVPHHSGIATQTSPSPYVIEITPEQYGPGDLITVRLHSPVGQQFRGYQIHATQVGGNIERFVGVFLNATGGSHLTAWYPEDVNERNCFTHSSNDLRSEVTAFWRAPNVSVGEVKFSGTIMKDFKTFWINLESAPLTSVRPKEVEHHHFPVYKQVTPTDSVIAECGLTRNCVLYPQDCDGEACTHAIAYAANLTSKFIDFYVFVRSSAAYVSLGFSSDKWMGNDSTVNCVSVDSWNEVYHAYSPMRYNERHLTDPNRIRYAAVARDGNSVSCSFQRSFTDSVLKYSLDTYEPYYVDIDLTEKKFVQLAWGGVYTGTPVPKKHDEIPINTAVALDLLNQKYRIDYAVSIPTEYRVHGSFGVAGWILLASIGMLASRHYKLDLTKKLGSSCFEKPLWFHMHFWSMLTSFILVAISIIVIFVYVGKWTKNAIVHSIFGIIVISLGAVNILAGFLRPEPDSKYRPLFLWLHRTGAVVAFICAWVTVFLGANAPTLQDHIQTDLNIVLAIWLVILFVFEVALELVNCYINRQDRYQVSEKGDHAKTPILKWVLLAAFLLCSAGLFIAFVYIIATS